jgi:plastocyanin
VAILALGIVSPLPARAAAVAVVELFDDTFNPETVRVEPGDRVMWVNHGRHPHNVLASDGSWGSRILQPGDSFSVVFPKVGRFGYYCSLHGVPGHGMIGRVLVGTSLEDASQTSASRSYPATPPIRPAGGRRIRVPVDVPTIQAAVNSAAPGDLILVAAGVYREAVVVTTPNITIRGEDRNTVILDGGLDPDLKDGIAVFGADGVVVENMTARQYAFNGFYWRSVWGYRGSYLTAYNNGDYGIYALDSGVGQFDHSFASGQPDSGFYIGQCDPCNAVVTDVIASRNGIGFVATNASRGLVVRDSEFGDNMAGIVVDSSDGEALPPQRSQTIVHNWVHDNGDRGVPGKALNYPFLGYGIAVVGGNDNEIAYNRVEGNATGGIAVAFSYDRNFWLARDNGVHDNSVRGSGIADLALIAPAGGGNCFRDNEYGTSLPPAIQTSYGCGSTLSSIGGGDLGLAVGAVGRLTRGQLFTTPHGDRSAQPVPPAQSSMPAITGEPDPAGPPAVFVSGEDVARARAEGAPPARGANAVAANAGFIVLDDGVPLLFLAGVAILAVHRKRRRSRWGRVFVFALPALFVIAEATVLVSELAR